MAPAKIFIGIKTRGRIIAHLFVWLGKTMQQARGESAASNEIGYVTVYNSIGKPEDVNQNNVFQEFLKTDCTHLLCIDDDIMADEHLLERLLKYDLDIVASPVLIMGEKGVTYFASWYKPEDNTYETVDIFPPNNKLQECDAVGFGCILIKRKVVEEMPDPKYETVLSKKGFMEIPPDNQFCFKAKKLGYQIHVDGTMMIGQMSEFNLMYTLQGYPNFVPPIEEINKSRVMHKWLQQNKEDFDQMNPIVKTAFEMVPGMQQLPSELNQLLEYLKTKTIRTYLEIGSLEGGTMGLFSEFLPEGSYLFSIDVNQRNTKEAVKDSLRRKNHDFQFIEGNSGNMKTVGDIDSLLKFYKRQVDLLLIDGDHYHAETDFRVYSKFVRPGGIIVLHDINKNIEGPEANTGTVPEFWNKLRTKGYNFREFVAGDKTGYGIGVIEYES